MRALLALHVDGIISDRPDILQSVLKEARAAAANNQPKSPSSIASISPLTAEVADCALRTHCRPSSQDSTNSAIPLKPTLASLPTTFP